MGIVSLATILDIKPYTIDGMQENEMFLEAATQECKKGPRVSMLAIKEGLTRFLSRIVTPLPHSYAMTIATIWKS